VTTVNAIGADGAGLSGVLRMTWMRDDLAHVLGHCEAGEPSGTWTGLACPDHGLVVGSDVDGAVLKQLCGGREVADLTWEGPAELVAAHGRAFGAAMRAYRAGNQADAERLWGEVGVIWSHAWAANYAALEFMQQAGLAMFGPGRPQRWVIASFEHHCGSHGWPRPHVHNLAVPALTA
jgi:hypothetical protein